MINQIYFSIPYKIPCFDLNSLAILPFQDQPEVVKTQRKLELQQRQESYKWGTFPGFEDLPGHLQAAKHSDIPRDSQFSHEAKNSIADDKKKAVKNLGLSNLATLFEAWDNFDDFQKILKRPYKGVPKIVEGDRWMTDSVYGSIFLNGCHPNVIERCTKLPGNFPLTNVLVKSTLDRGLTLEQEMKVCSHASFFLSFSLIPIV